MPDEEKLNKTKMERIKEEWRAAGIEIEELDLAPGSHIIMFFGAVPEGSGDEDRGDEDEEPA
jgi:hypothetical protein